MDDKIRALWERLNRPAPAAFARELRRRGIYKKPDLEQEGSKQLFKRPPRYQGHIYSTGPWQKVFMDIMVLNNEKYYLVAVDEFSRLVMAKRIDSPADAYLAARAFIKEWGHPKEIVTDEDPAFRTIRFQALGEKSLHVFKEGRQDLAVVDRAIGIIKRALAEGTPSVAKAVEGINARGNERTLHGAAPGRLLTILNYKDKAAIFERFWDEAENMKDNTRALRARGQRLQAAGAFRVYQPSRYKVRRVDEPVWSREVYRVAKIDGAHVYGDDGRRHLTKEVLPVSAESRPAPGPPLRKRPRELLRHIAEFAVEILRRTGPLSQAALTKQLQPLGNMREALRAAGANYGRVARSLVRVFPDLLRLTADNRVAAAAAGSGS